MYSIPHFSKRVQCWNETHGNAYDLGEAKSFHTGAKTVHQNAVPTPYLAAKLQLQLAERARHIGSTVANNPNSIAYG